MRVLRMGVLEVVVAICLLALAIPTQSQTHGSVTGLITDGKSGQPLGYANVMLAGTKFGAMSLDDGRFEIPGVPPGKYVLKVSYMGFKSVQREVVVDAGAVTNSDFQLEEAIVNETTIIWVHAEKPEIDVNSSTTEHRVEPVDFQDAPFVDFEDVFKTKAGVTQLGDRITVRGGRPNEVQRQIDGVPVDGPLGGRGVGVNRFAAAGGELLTGGMDAEFGNAQSAIMVLETREGGSTFGGDFRYMTDRFGREDKTYTNYDNIALGFGGPTPWRSIRYYVSAEATLADGENVSIEPRIEHKITDWLKARERMNHDLNIQSKLTWKASSESKVTGEAIWQRGRYEQYLHNWNVSGYVRQVHYFQRLVPTNTGQDRYAFGPVSVQNYGPWIEQVNDPAQLPNPRSVIIEQTVRDENGEAQIIEHSNFRAVDINGVTILWDEAIASAGGTQYKSWQLFEGFQFPHSEFSHSQEDTSFVFFNSAERTPQTETNNLILKLGYDHVAEDLLYSVRLSRLAINRTFSVDGKQPHEYSSAGMPVTLPDGNHLESGVTQPTWYTDPDHPYFVTAYDYPMYDQQNSVQYLARFDFTNERIKGHRIKTGVQFIYNDINNDTRINPALQRTNPDGSVQQGLNVNLFHAANVEGAAYLQDKWEYEGMVVNAGVRVEYFSVGNQDQILISNSEINPQVEKHKFNWSPRLGIAFPITDRDKFFFSYGHYTQWPSRAYLFASQDGISPSGPLGNPNLGEELTVSYQAGIGHMFSHDVVGNFAVFHKDIFGLASSTFVTDDSTGIRNRRWVNKTYASSRGLEISLQKRLVNMFGFETSYTYSFADGVASEADVGRSANGLTHLPTDELPLNWDQRHTLNVIVRLENRNNWGGTMTYQYGSGMPWTPYDRFARLQDPLDENSRRLPATHRLRIQGRKRFNVYGRELTLFFEGFNLLDQDILLPGMTAPPVAPALAVGEMDQGAYMTETGRAGGAYMKDIDDDGIDDFVPVHDPTVYEGHRQWRIGFGYQF